MTKTALINGQIVTPDVCLDGAVVIIEDGKIAAITDHAPNNCDLFDLKGGYLLPGFIDTQVNGGGGVLFNDNPTIDGIKAIRDAHRRFGTTGMLPTLITDRLEVVKTAMDAVDTAISQGLEGIFGIHIEGPFLNRERKGIHNPDLFRLLDQAAKALMQRPQRGRVMVTLAPETCSVDDIKELTDAGIIISAGHTNATYEETVSALAAGVTGFTHLYNAMSPLYHRAPGVVGAALENQTAWCGIILDGAHVHPGAIRAALKARPLDRFMIVTDAMPTVGHDSDTFILNGWPIKVVDGICRGPDGTLAGSNLDMASAVRYAVKVVGVTIGEAAIMAATAPAAFLGLSPITGAIAEGLNADLVCLNADLRVRHVWQNGVRY